MTQGDAGLIQDRSERHVDGFKERQPTLPFSRGQRVEQLVLLWFRVHHRLQIPFGLTNQYSRNQHKYSVRYRT